MRGWRSLIAKDLRTVVRNRILLGVLILYPFLIICVVGAVFQETGRPVPVGLVNLDGERAGQDLWISGVSGGAAGWRRALQRRAERFATYASREEAQAALAGGGVNALLAVVEEGGGEEWYGGMMAKDDLQAFILDVEAGWRGTFYAATAKEAMERLREGAGDAALGFPAGAYPYLAETIWLEGVSRDAASLVGDYSRDVMDITTYDGEEQALADLRTGRLDAVLVISPGFVHRLKTLEEVAGVRVVIDQSNMVKAEFAETGIRGFLSRVSERVVEEKMRSVVAGLYVLVTGGDFFGTQVVGLQEIGDNLRSIREAVAGRPDLVALLDKGIELADTVVADIEDAAAYLRGTALPVELEVSSVAGRTLAAKDAVIPSLVVLSMLWTGVLCGAILMVLEDEEGMRVRLSLTPMGPFALVGSKLLLAGAVVFLQSVVMLLLAVAVFGAYASSLPLALLTAALASLSCIGIGLVLAAFARQVAGAVILSVLVAFPLIFMTGAIFPLSQMPGYMQTLARAIPLTYALDALSGVMLRGESLAEVAWKLAVLLGFGVFLLGLGSALVRRRSR
ncbi:MAG: ABC transporter permease [Actinobacteria bacterium]|nr:ABC transporter permease [Actinomycetota bacterium]